MKPRRTRRRRLETRVMRDRSTVHATLGPLPLELALDRLPEQCDLAEPAKLALAADGSALLQLELPRAERASLEPAAERARATGALERAHAWLSPRRRGRAARPSVTPAAETSRRTPAEVEAVLAELPWSLRETGDDRWLVDASALPGTASRVTLETRDDGSVRAHTATALHVDDALRHRALSLFALEANRRVRLARIGVDDLHDESVGICWEAILPGDLPVVHLVAVVNAVVYGQALTRRSFQLLATEPVAHAYLWHRHGENTPQPHHAYDATGHNVPIARPGEPTRHPIAVETTLDRNREGEDQWTQQPLMDS